MTKRAASLLLLIAMAISGAYAVPSMRLFNTPTAVSISSEKSDHAEVRPVAEALRATSEVAVTAAIPEAPALRAPHLDPRYQRPPPSR